MATSGVTDWSVTALDIVKAAMGPILDPGEEPDSDEAEDCITHLNGLLKSWQMRGALLSSLRSATVVTAPATASVSLPDDVRSIITARLVVSATNERQLWPVERQPYFSIPNKAAPGYPSMYYLDRQRDAAVLYLWPVSATAATIKIDYERLIETVTATTETLDLRQELFETVWTNLSAIIGPAVFGTPAPPEIAARAAMLEMQMLDAERPNSYRFETDYDYTYA